MTNTQIYAHEQAHQIRNWHHIQPHLQDQLSQMSDEQAQKVMAGTQPKNETRSKAFQKLAEPYLPLVWKEKARKRVEPLPISKRTAQGIVDAQKAGVFGDNELWLSIAHIYERIFVTARG